MGHVYNYDLENGKSNKNNLIFYDSVYGHIRVTSLACAIIDSKEFQRLRRIKQLSMGALVFPCAEHTRFSHSLGTYHVMTLITERLREELSKPKSQEELPEPKSQSELSLYLEALEIAALLHDVGHGPYSHSFEQIISSATGDTDSHEHRTREIIESESTEIHEILQKYSASRGKEKTFFQNLVLSYLCKDSSFLPASTKDDIAYMNLYKAFSSLISSNLDADRLDYLQRDALFCGAVYGKFDLESIISGLRIIYNYFESPVIAIEEEKIADLEGYLILRSQMYKNVYYKRQKVFAEDLLVHIFNYARELFYCEILSRNAIPPAIRCLFEDIRIEIVDYCSLDDYIVLGTIRGWSTLINRPGLRDLATMCLFLLERRGYVIINVESGNLLSAVIKNILCEAIKEKSDGNKILENTLSERESIREGFFPFWIYKTITKKMFDNSPIYVVQPDSMLSTLVDKSFIIKTIEKEEYKDCFAYWSDEVCAAYLESVLPDERDQELRKRTLEKIRNVINLQNMSTQCEHERKYRFNSEIELQKFAECIESYFSRTKYSKNDDDEQYTDVFLDSNKLEFYKQNVEIRIRYNDLSKSTKLIIKAPIDCKFPQKDLSERRKHQIELDAAGKIDAKMYKQDILQQLNQNEIPWSENIDFSTLAVIRTKRKQTIWDNKDLNSSFIINRDVIDSNECISYLLEVKFQTEAYNNFPFVDLMMTIKKHFPNADSYITVESKLQAAMKQFDHNTV